MNNFKVPIVSRLLRGFGAHGFMQAVQLFIRLAEVPLFLSVLGVSGYGEWLMITTLPSALALSDGGFTKAAQREMAMRSAREDVDGVQQTFQSAWVMLLMLTTTVFGTVLLAVPFLPIDVWLKLTTIDYQTLKLALIFLTCQVLLSFQCGLLYGCFASIGNYAAGTLYQAVAFLLGFLGLAVGLIYSGNVSHAAFGALIGQVVGIFVMYAAMKRNIAHLSFGFEFSSFAEMKRLCLPSFANLAFPVGEALNIHGVRLLVGITLGPVVLSTFSTLRTLCRMALQPVLSVARTVEPEISLAYGSLNVSQMRRLLVSGTQAATWFAVLLCLLLLIFGQNIFNAWVNQSLVFEWKVFLLLLVTSFIGSIWCVALTVPCATNRHHKIAICFLFINGLLCIALSYIFIKMFGIYGVASALLIAEILIAGVVLFVAGKQVEQSFSEWLSFVFRFPLHDVKKVLRKSNK